MNSIVSVVKVIVSRILRIEKIHNHLMVDVNIILRPRNLRLMDIDNCIKPILDALQDAGLMDDDKQVGHVSIRRGLPIPDGKCIVSIEVLQGDNDERTLTSRG